MRLEQEIKNINISLHKYDFIVVVPVNDDENDANATTGVQPHAAVAHTDSGVDGKRNIN